MLPCRQYITIKMLSIVGELELRLHSKSHVLRCMILFYKIYIYSYTYIYTLSGAFEPPEGRKERPTPHYRVERHLNLNGRDTSLIWTYSQVGRKCCFHSHRVNGHAIRPAFALYRACIRRALAMTVTGYTCFSVRNRGTRKRTQNGKAWKAARAVHALVLPTWLQE